MILKFLLNILATIITTLINIVNSTMPNNNLGEQIGEIIKTILTITQQALNFMYLIFGDTIFLVMPTIITLLAVKYLAFPIISIARSFFIGGNE